MQAPTVPELLDSRLTLEHSGLEPNVVRTAAVAAGLITQLCPTLCNPTDCSPPAPLSMGCSRQEYWSGLPFPPGDLSNPGIEPESQALQADS